MLYCIAAACSYRRHLSPRISVGYACVISFILPWLLGGCVAFNIPSVRYDDPADRGGLFGPQKPIDAETREMLRQGTSSAGCHDCAADEDFEMAEQEAPPEVPWPRFHPLPTRPVFSLPAE